MKIKLFFTLAIIPLLFFTNTKAQTRISSSLFSINDARQLGPGTMSGRITSIEGVLADSGKTIYVGAAGGGVWKSTNAGTSYQSVFDKYCQSIGAIGIDQKNPKTLYVGTGESNMRNTVSIGNGMYKSTDAGGNWKKIGLDSTEHIARIIVNPNDSKIIYCAAPGPLWSPSTHRGLYKSKDGGDTWEKILYKDENTGCAEIIMDPTNPEIIYASMWEFRRQPFSFNSGGKNSGLFKSTNGGKTWKELSKGLPEKPLGRIAMNIAPSNPQKLIAIVESKTTGLYISEDAGETWKSQSATMNVEARPFYFSTILFHPNNEKRVYRPAFMMAYSDDGGYSFADASSDGGWVHSDMHALWINPTGSNIMYLGTDGGVYTSLDQGVTWIFNQALPVGQFYHIDADNQEPYNVYGGLQDNGSWYAPSSAPGGVGNAHWSNLFGGDGFWTVPDADGKTIYAEYQGGNVQRIDKKTLKAVNIQPQKTAKEDKLRWNWNTPIVTGQSNPKNLYIGAQYLYKSTDQGRNWTRLSGDLTTNDPTKLKQEESGGLSADNTSAENHCTIFSIAESPQSDKIIWIGTDDGNLQLTTDGGKSYTNLAANIAKSGIPKGIWISSIEPSHYDTKTVFITLDNHNYGDHQTYLVKSTDQGKTWTWIKSDEFTGFAHKIVEDFVNPNLLFLGTEMGLFCTLDGGEKWFRMKNNIPEYAMVRDIKLHKKSHDLIVGTHGRGIYILDDIRFIRNLTKDVLEKDVHVFDTPPLVLRNGKFGWGGPQVSGGWATNNAQDQPSITYYLKNRMSSGNATLDIYDKAGVLIQSVPATMRKGINKVDWNLRETPPQTVAGGAKADRTSFVAPMVLPGIYTAKLNLGDDTYESKLNCIADPDNNDLSDPDRKLIYNKSHEIKSIYEKTNETISAITKYQLLLKKDEEAFKNNKKDQKLYDELEALRAELLATKQTSIFADEEKLREKISNLYITFCTLESKPNSTQLEAIPDITTEFTKLRDKVEKLVNKNGDRLKVGY